MGSFVSLTAAWVLDKRMGWRVQRGAESIQPVACAGYWPDAVRSVTAVSAVEPGGAPALVEAADGEDAVLVAGPGEGVLDSWKDFGSRDGATVATAWYRAGERQGRHGNQRLVALRVLSSHPSPPPLTSAHVDVQLSGAGLIAKRSWVQEMRAGMSGESGATRPTWFRLG